MDTRDKRVVVIGAGLGGLSAALSLACEGYAVTVIEKNDRVGGKLNVLSENGYTFDLGPSILTLPHLFERLFTRAGRRMEDYFTIRPLRPHWRNFFEDGTVVDLDPDRTVMHAQCRKVGLDPDALDAFLKYSADLYDLINEGYFEQGLDTVRDFQRHYGLWKFRKFDLLRTMHGGVKRRIDEPHLQDVFDFFIKYVGSSAYNAPAFMNCLPTIQFRHDLWYVDGSLYNIARGLEKLAAELGVDIRLRSEVSAIRTDGGRATGAELRDGSFVPADITVCNMEVIPAYKRLLGKDDAFVDALERRFEPACSGLVLDLGLDCKYEQLAHHNFFFSGNQKQHFDAVFNRHEIPSDPTIYLVAASRTDPTVAPEGCDCLKVLPHIPYINEAHPAAREDYEQLKERVIDKLERMGLTDLRTHVVFEHMWTPEDIQSRYYSNRGSIYGVVADRAKNLGFKAPKHSTELDNLFFVGGSVNPGGGMPMVVLCGQNVCRTIRAWDAPNSGG